MRLLGIFWVSLSVAQVWQEAGGGANAPVHALLSWNGYLYVGGRFTAVDGTALQAQGIARWTGSNWQTISNPGAGGNGIIYAMTVYQGKLIVGGDFTGIGGSSANNLAAYDPATGTWSSVGGGVNGPVQALYVYQGELLVGGVFTRVGLSPNEQTIAYFARWDGASWKAPDPRNPSHLLAGGVLAFAEYNGKLYLGGTFPAAYYNETDKAYLAIWDKSTQRVLPAYPAGQEADNFVRSLAVWNNKLYIGGDFQMIGGVSSPRLAALSGTTYEAVPGSPTNGQVRALLATPSHLYVAGNFTNAGGQTINRVARLSSGGVWSNLGSGIGPLVVNALALHNGYLYAGGNFTQDGAGQPLAHIALLSQPAAFHALSEPFVSMEYSPPYLIIKAEKAVEATLTLSNSLSQIVFTQSLALTPHTAETISLSGLPSGFYGLSVVSDGQRILGAKLLCVP